MPAMKQPIGVIVAIAMVASAAGGCGRGAEDATLQTGATTKPAALAQVPLEITVRQRSTSAVPGSRGQLMLSIDDITRGQVMVSLAGDGAAVLVAPRSLSAGDTVEFIFGGGRYLLTLTTLRNALTGEDHATFSITAAPAEALSEVEKIEALIDAVASLQGSRFIRNGREHDAPEAADHLRSKWRSAGERIATARQFIDHIASRSSLSGQPYQIRLSDGRTVASADWLHERLAEIEQAK